jgi:hypothetical protein
MKAVELAIKAVLIVDGGLGWWERLLQTHKPLNEIKNHDILGYHFRALEQHDRALVGKVVAMETLAPTRPDQKSFSFESQVNTEYPFFYLRQDPAGGDPTAHLEGPRDYFDQSQSEDHYRTAHRLLTAYQILHAAVGAWGQRLPKPL